MENGSKTTKKIGLVSLGCPKNLVDSEAMLGLLATAGYELTPEPSEADFLVVNTCGFIGPAKKESVEAVLRMARYRREGKCKGLIVTGCLVQRYQEQLQGQIPEIDAFLGTSDFSRIVEAVSALEHGGRDAEPIILVGKPTGGIAENVPRLLSTPGASAYLKISEGCDHACAFCVVPSLRGRMRSRPLEGCLDEARRLADLGVKELNLISQSTSEYGRDLYGAPRLRELLQGLAKIKGLRWIRFHYLYPAFLDDKLLDFWAQEAKIVRYVDLPLQHADSAILKSMGRPGTYESNLRLVERLRHKLKGCVIRSAFILGYPGETDAAFGNVLKFLKATGLERVGFFAFSREEGTRAFSLKSQVPDAVIRRRIQAAAQAAGKISRVHLKSLRGSVMDVLVEPAGNPEGSGLEHGTLLEGTKPRKPAGRKGLLKGRGAFDAPEIDGQVYITPQRGSRLKAGDFARVKITSSDAYDLFGREER
jgi:ribosomal protein S12 methylthiotransferase